MRVPQDLSCSSMRISWYLIGAMIRLRSCVLRSISGKMLVRLFLKREILSGDVEARAAVWDIAKLNLGDSDVLISSKCRSPG